MAVHAASCGRGGGFIFKTKTLYNMNILKRIKAWFHDPTRKHPKDVKVGEWITIYNANGVLGVASAQCLSNDPKTKKMFVWIIWGRPDGAKVNEYLTLPYSDHALKDFHLLNTGEIDITRDKEYGKKENIVDDDTNIASLQNRINQAIEKEDYETAEKLQKQIDKLLNKNK